MKTAAVRKLRQTFAAGGPALGLWVSLESASVTEMAVALGLDWVVIDAEHGQLDWNDIVQHLRATVRSDTVALVRLAELTPGLVKRALDLGADGVVLPRVETVEHLRQAVYFSRYPPEGYRGIGAERATAWGHALAEHTAEADAHVLVVPIIESVAGAAAIGQLVEVPGVELFWIGPADFSATAGYPGQWEGPGVAEQVLAVKDAVRRAGKHCGVLATGTADLANRHRQGFTAVGLGLDAGLLLRTLREMLASAGRNPPVRASLAPDAPPEPLPTPDPDRLEAIAVPSVATPVEIEPGVTFRPLAGAHNNARGLTTGLVRFAPSSELPYHTHAFTEVVTLLSGEASFEVEGRRYRLGRLDTVTVPPGRAHAVRNVAGGETVFHIAMATTQVTRQKVERPDFPASEPADGPPGAERVRRHATAPTYELSPGAHFQDFFNRDLGCDTLSGGYGRFEPGARLPCHLHDFDESICIVEGTATCFVEGRRHTLEGCATAIVPRGRCHYFVNDSGAPMAMVWVYAGPMPERVVLPECCCRPGPRQ